ncbi:hypothetical protein Gotur_015605 [Gossypium turneri]
MCLKHVLKPRLNELLLCPLEVLLHSTLGGRKYDLSECFCQNWYCLSKTEAESEAFEFAKSSGLDVVTVCPSLILGPLLQPTINASCLALVTLLKEKIRMIVEFKVRMIVDVRDVAEALLLVYEKAEAEGRYICMAHLTNPRDLVDKLRSIFPQYDYPKRFIEGGEEDILSSEKL